jgi:hypothetical protein
MFCTLIDYSVGGYDKKAQISKNCYENNFFLKKYIIYIVCVYSSLITSSGTSCTYTYTFTSYKLRNFGG